MKKLLACLLATVILLPAFMLAQPQSAYAAGATIRKGSRGSDVKTVQEKLIHLGFLNGNADGIFGTLTHNAVVAYQRDRGLAADGVVGPATWAALDGEPTGAATPTPGATSSPGATPTPGALPTPAGSASPTATPTTAPTATATPAPALTFPPTNKTLVKRGSSGGDVKYVQEVLIYFGFLSGPSDGLFGALTHAAAIAYQRDRGLVADGVIGPKTYAAFDNDIASASGTPGATPTPSASPSSTGTPAATPNPTPATNPTTFTLPKVDGYTFGRMQTSTTLKSGNAGADVKDLQAALKCHGFYNGAIDGVFGSATLSAVKAWQGYLGLKQDGLAGNYTLSSVYSNLATNDVGTVEIGRYDPCMQYPLSMPTWASINPKFTRGSIAIVVDVETGYTYMVKRMGGSLHADVEPLTQLDTQTILKAYGGKWSWNRRAVWVILNGERYAASTNGMPHGSLTIKDNDMQGQICIHFVGSKTHGTSRVDPLHQAAIDKAFTTTSVPTK